MVFPEPDFTDDTECFTTPDGETHLVHRGDHRTAPAGMGGRDPVVADPAVPVRGSRIGFAARARGE
ncbi:hypothetical protein GCM10011588_12660 [Nocardia jinanensis]|uniref:Uncharacterized protein n=1 Tax=Nocardia jinanensis TaxID=382504 RepID=A0A917VNS2_9NOCA|nr:hypothetical protein GCM10011588_12660 [Nocardia jinanensis]